MRFVIFVVAIVTIFISCDGSKTIAKLPILGRSEVDTNSGDTTYHSIADFSFYDQDSTLVTNDTYKNKIYITDFFFTTCPDICPIMKTQMLRVYEEYKDNPEIALLSHTIDPKHDNVPVLKEFSSRLDVDTGFWKFVTGDKDTIYKLGQTSYMASIADDVNTGFVHSGRFFLIDKERQIRGAYDGTDPESVDYLIIDIQRLLNEYK